jgi:hypothetical protein
MGILSRLFGSGSGAKQATRDREAIAEAVLLRYRQRRLRGEFHVDNRLFVELCAELPEKAAQEVVNRFYERRAHSDPRAESKLGMEIVIALADADHFARTAQPILVEAQPIVEDHSRPSAANTYAKALEGRRITDADEDAVLFDDTGEQ